MLAKLLLLVLSFIQARSPCEGQQMCNRGVRTLADWGAFGFPLGEQDGVEYVPGYMNGTIIGGGVFCTSGSNCFLQSQKAYMMEPGQLLQLSAKAAFSSTVLSGNITSPLGIGSDPYYGYGSFGLYDPVSGWVFQFWITADKAYAVYGKLENEQNCPRFLYLVPVGSPIDCASYDIAIDSCKRAASYRMANSEVLRIDPVGLKPDRKFLVFEACGDESCRCGDFPESVQIRFGNGALLNATDYCDCESSYPACQGTFQECFDSVQEACRVVCPLNGAPQNSTTFSTGLALLFTQLSLMESTQVFTCPAHPCSSSSSCSSDSTEPCDCRFERNRRLRENQNRRLNRAANSKAIHLTA